MRAESATIESEFTGIAWGEDWIPVELRFKRLSDADRYMWMVCLAEDLCHSMSSPSGG